MRGKTKLSHTSKVCALLLAVWFASAAMQPVLAVEITPPFGLQRRDTTQHVEKLLKGAKAKIIERKVVEGRDVWTVEGLVSANLQRTIFSFKNNQLAEVELQYQNGGWDTAKYDDFMGQVRRQLDQKYGVGQLIARQKAPEGTVMQTVVGYKWNQNNTAIQLFYYSAEQGPQIFRAISVHYKLS